MYLKKMPSVSRGLLAKVANWDCVDQREVLRQRRACFRKVERGAGVFGWKAMVVRRESRELTYVEVGERRCSRETVVRREAEGELLVRRMWGGKLVVEELMSG